MAPMSLLEMERYAQNNGFNSLEFYADFPAGRQKCKWLDAYFGIFTVEALGEGFVRTQEMREMFPDLVCHLEDSE